MRRHVSFPGSQRGVGLLPVLSSLRPIDGELAPRVVEPLSPLGELRRLSCDLHRLSLCLTLPELKVTDPRRQGLFLGASLRLPRGKSLLPRREFPCGRPELILKASGLPLKALLLGLEIRLRCRQGRAHRFRLGLEAGTLLFHASADLSDLDLSGLDLLDRRLEVRPLLAEPVLLFLERALQRAEPCLPLGELSGLGVEGL